MNYNERLEAFQNYLKEQQVDMGLITDPANVFYLTGFNSDPHESFMGLVVDVRKDEFILFVPALDQEMAKNDSIVEAVVPISDEEDPFSVLASHLGRDVESIGLEMGVVSMLRHQQLQKAFSKSSFTDVQPEINQMRQKKSRAEVEYMQEAVDLIEKVLAEGIKEVKIGMTEAELVGHFEFLMK